MKDEECSCGCPREDHPNDGPCEGSHYTWYEGIPEEELNEQGLKRVPGCCMACQKFELFDWDAYERKLGKT